MSNLNTILYSFGAFYSKHRILVNDTDVVVGVINDKTVSSQYKLSTQSGKTYTVITDDAETVAGVATLPTKEGVDIKLHAYVVSPLTKGTEEKSREMRNKQKIVAAAKSSLEINSGRWYRSIDIYTRVLTGETYTNAGLVHGIGDQRAKALFVELQRVIHYSGDDHTDRGEGDLNLMRTNADYWLGQLSIGIEVLLQKKAAYFKARESEDFSWRKVPTFRKA